jgi:4-amino-4-deoxy-L-arabinose transferase-like glycosyltransferase
MAEGNRLGWNRIAVIAGLAALTLGTSLGQSGRLTYHEAIWAQSAREMLAQGGLLVPPLDGRPWLEKPPLCTWLIAAAGRLAGGIDEAVARTPSALAAALLALGVAILATRWLGAEVGLRAALVQLTTTWLVMRGRLAEVDVSLACLVTWAIVAFDRARGAIVSASISQPADQQPTAIPTGFRGHWEWLFFASLGLSSLAKGIGFGAVLIMATIVVTLAWDHDRPGLRRLVFSPGWLLALVVALAWPVAILTRYPSALYLWTTHITDRLAARSSQFAGEPWWLYGLSPFWQTLPWTPFAIVGARRSWRRARLEPGSLDRLLWAWAVAPAILVSLASARNAHYLIYTLPPWSIWAAQSLGKCAERLGVASHSLAQIIVGTGLLIGVGFALLGPAFDRRGAEWAFYETAAHQLPRSEPLILLYDEWDRLPYATPFGAMPHDLPVRLFYLNRPASWRMSPQTLAQECVAATPSSFAVIARTCDLPVLMQLGQVQTITRGPAERHDRAFVLYQVMEGSKGSTQPQASPRADLQRQACGRAGQGQARR